MIVSLELTPVEAEVLEEARRAGGFATTDDLVRVALWMEAEHLGVVMPIEAFGLPFRPELSRLLEADRRRREGDQAPIDADQPDLFATDAADCAPQGTS